MSQELQEPLIPIHDRWKGEELIQQNIRLPRYEYRIFSKLASIHGVAVPRFIESVLLDEKQKDAYKQILLDDVTAAAEELEAYGIEVSINEAQPTEEHIDQL